MGTTSFGGDMQVSCDELRRIIDQGGLALHYQPIMDLGAREVVGFEALVRLPHPRFGVIPAASFMPLVEKWGLNWALDEWVLWAASEQLAAWQDDAMVGPGFHVAVNVSGSEVDSCSLVRRIAQALSATGADATGLVVEFTETQQFEPHASRRCVSQLHDLGLQVALDDFGASYATFSRLRSLEFDFVKIDRSITSCVTTALGAGLMRTVVAACRDLGATVVAEGIETVEQAEPAEALGCDLGQGYLWFPALPVQEAELLLSAPKPEPGLGYGPRPTPVGSLARS